VHETAIQCPGSDSGSRSAGLTSAALRDPTRLYAGTGVRPRSPGGEDPGAADRAGRLSTPAFAARSCKSRPPNPLWGAPRVVLRDRDSTYGSEMQRAVRTIGIEEALTAPHAPDRVPAPRVPRPHHRLREAGRAGKSTPRPATAPQSVPSSARPTSARTVRSSRRGDRPPAGTSPVCSERSLRPGIATRTPASRGNHCTSTFVLNTSGLLPGR